MKGHSRTRHSSRGSTMRHVRGLCLFRTSILPSFEQLSKTADKIEAGHVWWTVSLMTAGGATATTNTSHTCMHCSQTAAIFYWHMNCAFLFVTDNTWSFPISVSEIIGQVDLHICSLLGRTRCLECHSPSWNSVSCLFVVVVVVVVFNFKAALVIEFALYARISSELVAPLWVSDVVHNAKWWTLKVRVKKKNP